ncbi:hypothetical protein ACFOKJ_15090 [Vogesella amnigena]|uniref:Uncharacterized protein n=1 Tax=Vogesella amnigena TaxID=1507449 RepID=A0ABV7TXE6_9NEIS
MPLFLAVVLSLLAALPALPAIAETHATDEVVRFLTNPKFTAQQQALLREIVLDSYFDS